MEPITSNLEHFMNENQLFSFVSFLKCFSISPLSSSSYELFVIQSVYSCIIKVRNLNVDAFAASSHFTTLNRLLGEYSVEVYIVKGQGGWL